jgi:tripeptidyl-peptidase-1
MISAAFVLLSLAASGLAGSVVHESRGPAPLGWADLGRHAADAVLPLRFGLAQSNLDKIEEYLIGVSHPDSPDYGNHWSPDQVAKTFAPSKESVDAVTGWLHGAGLHPERVKVSSSKGWVEVKCVIGLGYRSWSSR